MFDRRTAESGEPTDRTTENTIATCQRHITRFAIGVIGVCGLAITAVSFLFAIVAQPGSAHANGSAQQPNAEINALRLVAESISNRDQRYDLALLLGVEAARLSDSPEVRGNLLDSFTSHSQLITYLRQQSWAWQVAFSPDSKTLASANEDGTVTLWDLRPTQPTSSTLTLQNRAVQSQYGVNGVDSVAFSPDGELLAAGSTECPNAESPCDRAAVYLIDTKTHQPIGSLLKEHDGWVWNVAFSPDGKTLAAATSDEIILWNPITRQSIGTLSKSKEDYYSFDVLAFSPNGRMLASSGPSNGIIIWDVTTRQAIRTLTGPDGPVRSLAFSPDGTLLASGDEYNSVFVWDTRTWSSNNSFHPLTGRNAIMSVAFSPDGSVLAVGGEDNTLSLWDYGEGRQIGQPLNGPTSEVDSLAFSPDGTMLASGGSENTLILWDMTGGFPIGQAITKQNDPVVMAVAFSPDGKTLALGTWLNTIALWSMSTRQKVGQPQELDVNPTRMVFALDGKSLAVGGTDGTVILWDMNTHHSIGQPFAELTNRVTNVALSPNGIILGAVDNGGSFILWNVITRQPLLRGMARSLAFSPDGKLTSTGDENDTITLWDVNGSKPIAQLLKGIHSPAYSLAFSPDGKILVSGHEDGTLIMWDVGTRQMMGHPMVANEEAQSATFSPDNRTLTTLGSSGIQLWDVNAHRPVGSPFGGSLIKSIAFNSDGTILASSGGWPYPPRPYGSTILWDLHLPSWEADACRIANRNLTVREWAQYVNPDPSTYRATCPNLPIKLTPTPAP